MGDFIVKDGAGATKYLKASGEGTQGDPFVLERLDSNSADIKTATQAVQAAIGAKDDAAATTDTGTFSLIALTKHLLEGITALTAKWPVIGRKDMAGSVSVVVASDQASMPVTADTELPAAALLADAAANPTTPTVGAANLLYNGATWDRAPGTTANGLDVDVTRFPAGNLGQQAMAASLSVAPASDITDATYIGDVKFGESLPAGTANIGDVDVLTLPALPAGTNNIGDVDVLSIAAGDNNIGNVDIASAVPAGENLIGLVGASDYAPTVTAVLDTSAYGSGDLLFPPVEIPTAVRANGGHTTLHSVVITDIDDQKTVFTLVFLNAATSLGTANSAPDPDDTELLTIIGHVPVVAADWVDMGTGALATVRNIGLGLRAAAGTTSLWVAGINGTGTPTHSASGLKITPYFMRA